MEGMLAGGNRSYTARICSFLVALALLLFAGPLWAAGIESCDSGLYASIEFIEEKTVFSPYDKIFVKISCEHLEDGEHTVHVNWVQSRQGIVRSSSHAFSMDTTGERVVFFWFKLMKKGPLASAFSNQDFHPNKLGEWFVEIFLNDRMIAKKKFTITEGL